MHELDLISSIFYGTSEAIIALDLNGKVLFWNNAAEKLFGYKKDNLIGKYIPIISNQSKFELNYVIQKTIEGKQTNFRTQKQSKDGSILDLIFATNPITNQLGEIIGVSIIVQQMPLLKKISYLPLDIDPIIRGQKRTFEEIRNLIMLNINNKKTINQIANDSGVNWRTVEKHLTFLMGKKLVKEIFSSEYVRIFELTELGNLHIQKLKKEGLSKLIR